MGFSKSLTFGSQAFRRIAGLSLMTFVFCVSERPVVSDESASANGDEAAEMIRAILANIVAVKNYDVRFTHKYSVIPTDPDDGPNCQVIEDSFEARIVYDALTNQVFRMHDQRLKRNSSKLKPDSEHRNTFITTFQDGISRKRACVRAHFSAEVKRIANPWKVDYKVFCNKESFTPPHLLFWECMTNGHPVVSVEDFAANNIEAARRLSQLEYLPDGRLRWSRHQTAIVEKSLPELQVVRHVDAVEMRFLDFNCSERRDGKWRSLWNANIDYDDSRFPYLPTRISYSKMKHLTDDSSKAKVPKRVPADQVGVMTFDWIHVNAETPTFPAIESFDDNLSAWQEYMNPKELRKEESNDIQK